MRSTPATTPPAPGETDEQRRLRIATDALSWLSTHVIGDGGTAAWRVQRAAALARDGVEAWHEPLTRPDHRTEKRDA